MALLFQFPRTISHAIANACGDRGLHHGMLVTIRSHLHCA